jgi:hypothetical protein
MARFRLTGDFVDLAEADSLLRDGLASAPEPGGPVLSAARLGVLVHRLPEAERALTRFSRAAVKVPEEVSEAAALTGDIALQRGQLVTAAAAYARAEALSPSVGGRIRIATVAARRGDVAQAVLVLEQAIARARQQPAVLAELMLQRANLAYATGEWNKAGGWVAAAQRVFPGYWLAEAYAAQQLALSDQRREAAAAYTALARSSGRPEVMDALSHLLRLEGRAAESRAWAARAASAWEEKARLFPQAVLHHLAEHELAVGSAGRARQLAQTDARLRPQAPNLVLLARSELLLGRARDGAKILQQAEAQGWVSASIFAAQAEAAAALGDENAAAAALEQARELNPKTTDPRSRLIWFGHD